MERIRIADIKEGQTFEGALFLPTGQKLINAHVSINSAHLRAIRRCGVTELNVCDPSGNPLQGGASVAPADQDEVDPAPGEAAAEPEAAPPITLREREDHNRGAALADQLTAAMPSLPLRAGVQSTSWLKPRAEATGSPAAWERIRTQGVAQLQQQFELLLAGKALRPEALESQVDNLLQQLSDCPSRFACMALPDTAAAANLASHGFSVATLAVAMAAKLRWSREDARRVGVAAMLCDVGMLLIPDRIRNGCFELSALDRERVNRHPLLSLTLLNRTPDLPEPVTLAVLQHHERENGSGYPHHRRRESICDYARVLAVADSYVAATEPRQHRPAKLPYVAMEQIIRSVQTRLYWPPAVRALVHAAGLFPVGSYVKLSDNRVARVLACHPELIDRPLVQITLDPADRNAPRPTIDLSQLQKSALGVVRPMPTPEAAAVTAGAA